MGLVHRGRHVADWTGFGWVEPWRRWFPFEAGESWLRTEEFHDGDTLVVRAELPGIDPERDVEITADGDVVRIHAHREQKAEHKDKQGYRSEFRYGEFSREIALPRGASPDDVKASYHNGILEVRIPCTEHGKREVTRVQSRRTEEPGRRRRLSLGSIRAVDAGPPVDNS